VTAGSTLNFNGGSIAFATTVNADADDRFTIRNQGAGPGQISATGTDASYGGVVIGTRSGGTGTSPLIITFNSNATIEAIQALIRNILWRSPSASKLTRTLTVSLTDSVGATSLLQSKQVVVS
jgi:hypothetical protein